MPNRNEIIEGMVIGGAMAQVGKLCGLVVKYQSNPGVIAIRDKVIAKLDEKNAHRVQGIIEEGFAACEAIHEVYVEETSGE